MFRRHPMLSVVTFAYLGLVGWITLGPQPIEAEGNSLLFRALRYLDRFELTSWISYNGVEFTANVFMFLPIGVFFLLLFGRSWWFMAFLAGVSLTAAIEFVQRFLPGRVSDVRDLISNSAGALIGVIVALLLTAAKARQLRRSAASH